MSTTSYQMSSPVFLRGLSILSDLLRKGEAHAAEKGIDPASLLDARLAPDMLPFTRQVQFSCDTAKRGVARLTGIEAPSYADDETSFAQLQARIDKTKAFVAGIPVSAFAGADTKDIELKLPDATFHFTGVDYLIRFALPNFYFHLTTAYDILRAQGVAIGKLDFLGKLDAA
jgi:hypothetical protein